MVPHTVKNLPAIPKDLGSIPGSGKSPGKGNGNPLQYSYLGNLMERGAWRTIVLGVAKSHDLVTKQQQKMLAWIFALSFLCQQQIVSKNLLKTFLFQSLWKPYFSHLPNFKKAFID